MASQRIELREVGARDGIQSLGAFVPTEQKIEMVNLLAGTGLSRIEATSFVSPKAVPQMADAEQVMAGITRVPGVVYEALVPNVRGAERALAAGVDVVLVVGAASETFNQRNVRMSVDDFLLNVAAVGELVRPTPARMNTAVATAFGCPYEGDVPAERLSEIVGRMVDLGVEEIFLADTTGMANPLQIERTVSAIVERFGDRARFGLHFHNTRGMGLANLLAGIRAGVTSFDASVAGIGGCPFAPKATGNICTEDSVHMLQEMGYETGIDLDALIGVADRMQEILGRELPGQVMKAGPVRHAA